MKPWVLTQLSIGFIVLFLNIFYISLYLKQSMILCPVSPQIWQEYFIGHFTLICWVVTSKIIGTWSSFLLSPQVSTLWFVLWQFVHYILVFSWIVWDFWANIVLLPCGTNKLLITFTLKIPFSQTKVVFLCGCKVSLFVLAIVRCKYGYNLDLKIVVKKLSVVLCWRLLANFNNLSK